jgi:hypothetical protein
MLIEKFGFMNYPRRSDEADDYRQITDERNNFFLSPAWMDHARETKVKASRSDLRRSLDYSH